MAIIATNTAGSKYEPIPAGNYPARCYSMIHIGTIEDTYLGQQKRNNKVRITWELPTELKVFKDENGEQPYSISKEFTLSMHEKSNLRAFLKNWRGKEFTDEEARAFDVEKLIGVACMLNIVHKGKNDGTGYYAEISAVSTMPRGYECPQQLNESYVFTYDDFDIAKFNLLPDFLREKMSKSAEYHFETLKKSNEFVDESLGWLEEVAESNNIINKLIF